MSVIRSLGFAFIVLACTVMGFSGASILRARVRILRELISSLELLKSEICTRLTPLPELMERFSTELRPPVSLFYGEIRGDMDKLGRKSFGEIWSDAVLASADLGLSAPEQETLILLGQSLGRFEASQQEQAISTCITQLSGFLDKAQEDSRSKGKMWSCLGASAGLIIAIALL